jgi:hypothetical protein
MKNPPTGTPAVGAYNYEFKKVYKISDPSPVHVGVEARQHVQLCAPFLVRKYIPTT